MNKIQFHSLYKRKRFFCHLVQHNMNLQNKNNQRKEIMKLFRGYPIEELFYNFPQNIEWKYVKFDADDFNKIYYIGSKNGIEKGI